jgi:hypothetical protein
VSADVEECQLFLLEFIIVSFAWLGSADSLNANQISSFLSTCIALYQFFIFVAASDELQGNFV